MKKASLILCLIAACAALCAAAWTEHRPCDEVPLTAEKTAVSAALPPTPLKLPHETEAEPTVSDTSCFELEIPCKESEPVSANAFPRENTPAEDCTEIPCNETSKTEPVTASNYDPYHTDVYSHNVYFEEYEYDENGWLKSKTTTCPCDFSSGKFIWIDGHAYADVSGFGLVEWGGPSRVTICYDMYENGNKVGIMGEDDERVPTVTTPRERVECTLDASGEIPPPPTDSDKPVIPADYVPGVIAD